MFNDPVFLALVLSYILCMILIAVIGGLVGVIHRINKTQKR